MSEWFWKNIHILEAYLHQKNSCTQPLPKKNPRTFSEPNKEHVTRRKKYHAYTSREKNKSLVRERVKKIVPTTNHSHVPLQKSNSPFLSDRELMHSSPRWIFFLDNKSLVIHAQRVVKTKWNSLNPKQNPSKPLTPLQMSVLEKLSTS